MGPPTPQTHRVLHDRHLGAGSTFRKRPAGRANGCGCSIGRGRRAAAPARARPRSIRSPREPWSRASRSRRPPAAPMISPGRAAKSDANRRKAKLHRHPFRRRERQRHPARRRSQKSRYIPGRARQLISAAPRGARASSCDNDRKLKLWVATAPVPNSETLGNSLELPFVRRPLGSSSWPQLGSLCRF